MDNRELKCNFLINTLFNVFLNIQAVCNFSIKYNWLYFIDKTLFKQSLRFL